MLLEAMITSGRLPMPRYVLPLSIVTVVPASMHDMVPPTSMTSVQFAALLVSIMPSSTSGIVGALIRHSVPRPVPKHNRASGGASEDKPSPAALSDGALSDGALSGSVNRHAARAMQANDPSDLTAA
jgi:hypothetical protein